MTVILLCIVTEFGVLIDIDVVEILVFKGPFAVLVVILIGGDGVIGL